MKARLLVCSGVAALLLASCAPAQDDAASQDQPSDSAQLVDTTQAIGTQTDSAAIASPDSSLATVRDSTPATTRPPAKQRPPIIGRDSVIQPVLVPNSEGRLVPRDTL